MELLDQQTREWQVVAAVRVIDTDCDELAARRSLRRQIAKLERELSDAFLTAYPLGGLGQPPSESGRDPRLLDLGELERVRDQLAVRLHSAREAITKRAEMQAANRLYLEQILLDPGKHRFANISCRDLGEPGCGVWKVRPRLGLIGMMMGWWQVKLSSGCPLPGGRGPRSRPGATPLGRWRMHDALRTGLGALLVVAIMLIGSLVMWIGAPLLWLWVGAQIEGAGGSLGTAVVAAFVGVVLTIMLLASVLSKLSNIYRANQRARGREDPGHFVLEAVLVTSAGVALVAFLLWFFLFSGAEPVPVGA